MPFDPRQPRYPSGDSTEGVDGAPRRRPGGLTAVCVIAIVLGALGLCMSLVGLASLAFQDKLEEFAMRQQQPPPGMPDGFLKAQMEMQKKIQEIQQNVTHRYRGANMGILLLNLVFASSLLAGGIMTLKMNPTARTFLVGVFAAVIVFEIVRTVVTVFMQLDMFAELSTIPSVGSGPADVILTFAKVVAIGGMAFGIVLGLGKVIFYAIGACYLRRPNIRQLFQAPTTDQM